MTTTKPSGKRADIASQTQPRSPLLDTPLQPRMGGDLASFGKEPAKTGDIAALGKETRQAAEKVGSEAADVAASIAADLGAAAKSATRAVQQQATEFASDVGQELAKTAEGQKERGVEAMRTFARAITSAAAELEQQSPLAARYVRDAASKVGSFSENIGSRDVNDLVKAANELARSQPLLFIGGAVAAGFMLSRFLKSSAQGNGELPRAETPELARQPAMQS